MKKSLNCDIKQLYNNTTTPSYYVVTFFFVQHRGKFDDLVCPVTKHLSCHGNTTVYQYKHGKVPDKIVVEDKFELLNNEPEEVDDEVGWKNILFILY